MKTYSETKKIKAVQSMRPIDRNYLNSWHGTIEVFRKFRHSSMMLASSSNEIDSYTSTESFQTSTSKYDRRKLYSLFRYARARIEEYPPNLKYINVRPAKKELLQPIQTESSEINKSLQNFIDLVKDESFVREIYISKNNSILTVWTIIEAIAFDDTNRFKIYDAQLKVLQKLKEGRVIGFRVMNVNEYEHCSLDLLLPHNSQRIFIRQ